MTWAWTLSTALGLAGAILVAIFGALVLTVRPRTRAATAVAVFSIAFGVATGASNLSNVSDEPIVKTILSWIAGAAAVALLAAILRMWWVLPAPSAQGRFAGFWLPISMTLVTAMIATGALMRPNQSGLNPVYLFVIVTAGGATFGLVALLASRLAQAAADLELWRQTRLIAVALVLYPSTNTRFIFGTDPLLAGFSWAMLVSALACCAIWLWVGHRAHQPRIARSVAWVSLTVCFIGLIDGLQRGGIFSGVGVNGIARILTVAVLSYAVVRHHVLGLDVKVRWTISKSTVAAVFIAVFFVASEVAQQFFGDRLGGTYVGIAAAGMLVFAIAPLQRAAERLAEKAVPITPARSEPAPAFAKEMGIYKAALRAAMRDGKITRREERHLAEVATRLDVTPLTASQWRDDVEAEHARSHPRKRAGGVR